MVPPVIKQSWTITAVLMNMLATGMSLGYTSVLLKAVQDKNGDIRADIHSASWTMSATGVGALPGFLVASFLMASYGRRFCHWILLIPAISSWLCIYFGHNVALLIIGRGIGGFSSGGLHLLECVVIGEYTSPKNRGVFITLKTAVFCIGSMVVHILAHLYDWKTISLVAPVPLILSLLITFTWPESPSWLVLKKRYAEGEKSFYWLRGKSNESKKEIDHLIRAQRERSSTQRRTSHNLMDNFKLFMKQLTKKDFIKPAVVILFSKILLEASGRAILPSFAMQIVEEVTGDTAHSLYYTFGIDIIVTLCSVTAFILFKFMKRRTLLFSTGFAAVFVIYIACGYMFLVSQDILSNDRKYIPTVLFAVFFGLCNLACSHLPFLLIGEIFPLAYREAGVCFSGVISSIAIFTALKFTPYLLVNTKVQGTFTTLGSVMAICLTALWFILPETKDRTLQEIEDDYVLGKVSHRQDNDEVNLKMISSEKR